MIVIAHPRAARRPKEDQARHREFLETTLLSVDDAECPTTVFVRKAAALRRITRVGAIRAGWPRGPHDLDDQPSQPDHYRLFRLLLGAGSYVCFTIAAS
jgi:hypothetical protein